MGGTSFNIEDEMETFSCLTSIDKNIASIGSSIVVTVQDEAYVLAIRSQSQRVSIYDIVPKIFKYKKRSLLKRELMEIIKHSIINWRVFWILLAASIIGAIAVIPFQFSLQGILLSEVPLQGIIFSSIIINGIIFSVITFIGLFLSKKIGFGAPILERLTEKKEVTPYIKSILGISIGLGFLAGILIIIVDYLLYQIGGITVTINVPVWQGFLGAFYGGVNEEILMRLFFMSLLIWIFFKIKKTDDGKPTHLSVWIAIIIAAIFFGIGHLFITSALTDITPAIIGRAILLNGIGGIIFGWLYWRKGLESAMISHFSTDIILYVIFPLIPL